MSFNGPLPRAPQYRPSETSRLNSQRDRGSLLHSWKNDRSQAGQIDKLNSQVSQNKRQLSRLSQQRAVGGMHPWKIYQFPQHLRRFRNSDDWRRFKVRGGPVLFPGTIYSSTHVGWNPSAVFGTDGYYGGPNLPSPYGDDVLYAEIPPTDATNISSTWHEAIVPADGTTYYFWYSVCLEGLLSSGRNHGVLFGSDWSNATSMETGQTGIVDPGIDPTVFPMDNYRALIGSVYIRTDSALEPTVQANVPYVTQFATGPLFFPGAVSGHNDATHSRGPAAMRFCGDYQAANRYYVGDTVTQEVDDGGGRKTLNQYCYYPPSTSAYIYIYGPISGVDPATNTPDPWWLVSSSHTSATYHVDGSYQAAKAYLRTA